MLVKKDDILVRGHTPYKCVCADEELFIIGEMRANHYDGGLHAVTSFEALEAYSNDESINTLEQLNFEKR